MGYTTLWNQVYNKAKNKGHNKAVKIANALTRKHTVIAKGSLINLNIYQAKSALSSSKAYFADFIFGDTRKDLDNEYISQRSLAVDISGMNGDLEHSNLFNVQGLDHSPLFQVIDSKFDGTHLMGTVRFNTQHDQFNDVWELCKNGEFGISLEYTMNGKEIVGITGTNVPKNQRSKVMDAYEVE